MRQPSLFTDLPRTLARIRRLVRENPNDRELQRLLHTLLTSMSAEKLDEEAISRVLLQMEQRCPTGSSPASRSTRPMSQAAPSPIIYNEGVNPFRRRDKIRGFFITIWFEVKTYKSVICSESKYGKE